MKKNILIFTFRVTTVFCVLITSCKKINTRPADIDGNVYNTVTIGSQVWMLENLKVTNYRNGDPIPNIADSTSWVNLSTGAYCDYTSQEANSKMYGKRYNWYVVHDSRNIVPAGWHVPTDSN